MPEPINSMQHNTWYSSVGSHYEDMQRLSIFGLRMLSFDKKISSDRNEEAELRNTTHGDEREHGQFYS